MMAHREAELTIHEETSNSLLHNSRNCCFCFPRSWWQPIRTVQIQSEEHHWWSGGVKVFRKIREWSEIVAGPKWKTFIRRFNRNKSGGNNRHGQFQYDPLSYALNFDEGPGQVGNLDNLDDFGGFRDFSTRYASVSGSGQAVVNVPNDVAVFG